MYTWNVVSTLCISPQWYAHFISAKHSHRNQPFDNTEFGKRRGRLECALWIFHQFVAESGTYVVLIGCVINNHKEYSRRKQGSQLALCRAEIAHLISSLVCCLSETFRWDLEWDVLFETFQTYHGGLLIWNFQMRLEMRCAIWNFWNFSNPSWRVAYLKLSDETWNEMCYLKLLKLETFETFQPITGVAYLKLSDEIWNKICCLKNLKCLKL